MKVRGVEIEVKPGGTAAAAAEAEVSADAAGSHPDEESVRAACARGLAEAAARRQRSVAVPMLGAGRGGFPVVASAKILAQEALRVARAGSTSLERIVFCCDDPVAFTAFEATINGYVRHFLGVLIWGPHVTVDAIIELPAGIVLVKRSNPPLGHALPGGFVDYGESLEQAVRRESMEETGLELLDLAQFHTYSDPLRDPRFQTVTTVFSARAEGTPRAGDDAADVAVVDPARIQGIRFAFDHRQVLEDWLAQRHGRGRSRYQP